MKQKEEEHAKLQEELRIQREALQKEMEEQKLKQQEELEREKIRLHEELDRQKVNCFYLQQKKVEYVVALHTAEHFIHFMKNV